MLYICLLTVFYVKQPSTGPSRNRTNQSSPLQGEIEGGGNIFHTDKYNAFLPARVGIL